MTLACGLPVILTILIMKPVFDAQYREDVRWTPILYYSPEIPIRNTLYATLFVFASFVPVWIAGVRWHRFWLPISIISVFGSWTCVGWIFAMVWACWPIQESR